MGQTVGLAPNVWFTRNLQNILIRWPGGALLDDETGHAGVVVGITSMVGIPGRAFATRFSCL